MIKTSFNALFHVTVIVVSVGTILSIKMKVVFCKQYGQVELYEVSNLTTMQVQL